MSVSVSRPDKIAVSKSAPPWTDCLGIPLLIALGRYSGLRSVLTGLTELTASVCRSQPLPEEDRRKDGHTHIRADGTRLKMAGLIPLGWRAEESPSRPERRGPRPAWPAACLAAMPRLGLSAPSSPRLLHPADPCICTASHICAGVDVHGPPSAGRPAANRASRLDAPRELLLFTPPSRPLYPHCPCPRASSVFLLPGHRRCPACATA